MLKLYLMNKFVNIFLENEQITNTKQLQRGNGYI